MGRPYTGAKQREKAGQAYNAARGVINKIMESLQDPELLASLVNHPPICQIFDLSNPDEHLT
jgi:hypothetical protein